MTNSFDPVLQAWEAVARDSSAAQQTKFGAISAQLGAAADATQAAAASLQQQTAELQLQLTAAFVLAAGALDGTADQASAGFQVSCLRGLCRGKQKKRNRS